MIYSKLINKVLKFVYDAHSGAEDKCGVPYVFHPFYLATQMDTEEEVLVALLHDIVEDTDYTFDDILALGVKQEVVDALKFLTRDKGVPYLEYVEKIAENPLAKRVKLADLRHNSDLSRLGVVMDTDLARVEKYAKAIKILTE